MGSSRNGSCACVWRLAFSVGQPGRATGGAETMPVSKRKAPDDINLCRTSAGRQASVSFGGSLAVDPALQQIMSNVLAEVCQPCPTLEVLSPGLAQATLTLQVHGRFGAHYLIEGLPDLSPNNWATDGDVYLD